MDSTKDTAGPASYVDIMEKTTWKSPGMTMQKQTATS